MSLTHNLRGKSKTILFGMAIVSLCGCQTVSYKPPAVPMAPEPAADQATQKRHWAPFAARYESDEVVAGPILLRLETDPGLTHRKALIVDPYIFMLDIVDLPVMVFLTPPNLAVQYHSMQMPPTYTAAPPIPPSPQPPPALPL